MYLFAATRVRGVAEHVHVYVLGHDHNGVVLAMHADKDVSVIGQTCCCCSVILVVWGVSKCQQVHGGVAVATSSHNKLLTCQSAMAHDSAMHLRVGEPLDQRARR